MKKSFIEWYLQDYSGCKSYEEQAWCLSRSQYHFRALLDKDEHISHTCSDTKKTWDCTPCVVELALKKYNEYCGIIVNEEVVCL